MKRILTFFLLSISFGSWAQTQSSSDIDYINRLGASRIFNLPYTGTLPTTGFNPGSLRFYPSPGKLAYWNTTWQYLLSETNAATLYRPINYVTTYAELTGKPTIPAQFNPIQGTNMVLTGTYPNITFSATTSGEGGGTVTSFSKTDGFGVISSVINPTTTPNYSARLDTTSTGVRTVLNSYSKAQTNTQIANAISPLAVDANVVHKTGNENVSGIKSFSDVINNIKGIQNISPTSADYSFLSNRIINNSTVSNGYAYYDANNFTKNYDNASYAAYSANTELGGSNSVNHYNAFQARANWLNTDSIINYRAFVDDNFISSGSGNIYNRISFHSSGGTNAGHVVNWYGLKVDRPPLTPGVVDNFYPIWIEGGNSTLGDYVQLKQDYTSTNGGYFRSYLGAAGNQYESSLGTNAGSGVGTLTLGNRGINEIRLGRDVTGGSLDVYINNTVAPTVTTSDGTKAFSITNTGVIKGNQFEAQSGGIIFGYTAPTTYLGFGGNVTISGTGKLSSVIAPTNSTDVVRLQDLSGLGSGTVTSFSKTDGFGIASSVANSTTTPNHTIAVDSTVIRTVANSLTKAQVQSGLNTKWNLSGGNTATGLQQLSFGGISINAGVSSSEQITIFNSSSSVGFIPAGISYKPNVGTGATLTVSSASLSTNRNQLHQDDNGVIALTKNYSTTSILGKTANYTVLTTDWGLSPSLVITVDATVGNVTITLPTVASVTGKTINIKRLDNSINTVTISGNGSNIDGASTLSLVMQWGNSQIIASSTQYLTL